MFLIICLIVSVLLNIRLAYCLGEYHKLHAQRHKGEVVNKVAQGGRKVLEEEVEKLMCVCGEEKKCCDNIKND